MKFRCFPSERMVELTDVRPEDIDVVDMAHGLSMICRFTGAVRRFYCVAQHSCLVTGILAMNGYGSSILHAALLHDAPEYLLGDVSTMLKRRMPDYQYYEDKAWPVFVKRFGIDNSPWTQRLVKEADTLAYKIEARALQGRFDEATELTSKLLMVPQIDLIPMSQESAKRAFLANFAAITETRVSLYRQFPLKRAA